MYYKEILPSKELADYIDRYFVLGKFTSDKENENLIIPDGTYGLIFMENQEIKRYSANDKTAGKVLNRTYLFGQKSKSVYYLLDKMNTLSFGLKIKPLGLNLLTSIPGKELMDEVFDTNDIFNNHFSELTEKIFEAQSYEKKAAVLDDYFSSRINLCQNEISELVSTIIYFIHKSEGQVSVKDLSSKFNVGYKKLERLFDKVIGISPKSYCRIIRFNSTVHRLRTKPKTSFTQISFASGYTDQNHFIKEVKEFTNLTPKEFFKSTKSPLSDKLHDTISSRFIR